MKEPFKFTEEERRKFFMGYLVPFRNGEYSSQHIFDRIEQIISSREAVEGGEVEAIRKELDFKETMYNASITVIKALRDDASKIKSELTALRAALSEKEERIAELEQVKVVVPSEDEIIKKSFHVWPVTQSSYHERIRVRYRENYRNDFNLFMDRLKELNPTMAFTELNHNEK